MDDAVLAIIGQEFGSDHGHCWRCARAVTAAVFGYPVLPEDYTDLLAVDARRAVAAPVSDLGALIPGDLLTMRGPGGRPHIAVIVRRGVDPLCIDTDTRGVAGAARLSVLRCAYGTIKAARLVGVEVEQCL